MTVTLTQQQIDCLSNCILSQMMTLRNKSKYFVGRKIWEAIDKEIQELSELHTHILKAQITEEKRNITY